MMPSRRFISSRIQEPESPGEIELVSVSSSWFVPSFSFGGLLVAEVELFLRGFRLSLTPRANQSASCTHCGAALPQKHMLADGNWRYLVCNHQLLASRVQVTSRGTSPRSPCVPSGVSQDVPAASFSSRAAPFQVPAWLQKLPVQAMP